jgi:hypothetical protein
VSQGGYTLHEPLPGLRRPVLVAMLTGWIDAGGAAASAMEWVLEQTGPQRIATFDGDVFIDYRARRPTMELRDGVNTKIIWPEIVLQGSDDPLQPVMTLSGPEPDAAWHRFAASVTELAVQFDVGQAVFLGAYPFAAPHTRPSRVACTSPSAEFVRRSGLMVSTLDVPAGVGAVLEHSLTEAGIPSIGLWAQVPHYLGTMAYPPATLALLHTLRSISGIFVDTDIVFSEALALRERLDQLVASNAEHRAMIEQLEIVYDQVDGGAAAVESGDLPDGDDLAAELEQFLRDQDG